MISLKEPNDDPQVIFERINSTGEDLKLADLIRNYLLMTDSNMDYLFEEFWLPMELALGKVEINKYFLSYIIYKVGEVKEKDAYQIFKKWADNSKLTHEEILRDLKYYSKFYQAFIGLDNNYSKEINNILEAFRSLNQSTIYIFLFSIFADYEESVIDEEVLLQVLLFYLNYTIRRLVVCVPSNSLRGLYRSLYKRIFKDDTYKSNYLSSIYSFMSNDLLYTKDATPNDTKFKEKLMNENIYKNRNLCKYLLSILENGINAIKEKVQIDSTTTIEHIMPQNKDNENWKNEIKSNKKIRRHPALHGVKYSNKRIDTIMLLNNLFSLIKIKPYIRVFENSIICPNKEFCLNEKGKINTSIMLIKLTIDDILSIDNKFSYKDALECIKEVNIFEKIDSNEKTNF